MSIDGVGKKGGVGTPADIGGSATDGTKAGSRADGAAKPFETKKAEGASATHPSDVSAVQGSTHLEALRSGRINLDRYLDLKVEEATAHLEGLGAADSEAIRSALRDKLATDPDLIELVSRATGSVPTPRVD